MTVASYDLEESSPQRGILAQIAVTVFVGVPMTVALAIGLAAYCTYECAKFALAGKSLSKKASSGKPSQVTEEQSFTSTLTQFASIHGASQKVENASPVDPQDEAAAHSPASVHKES